MTASALAMDMTSWMSSCGKLHWPEYAGDEVGIELVVHCGDGLDVVIGFPVALEVGDQIVADFGDCASPSFPAADPAEKLLFGYFKAGKCVVQFDLASGSVIQFPLVGLTGKEKVDGGVGNEGWAMEPVDQEAICDVGLVSQRVDPAGNSGDASYLAECEQFAAVGYGVDREEYWAVMEECLVLCVFSGDC